MTIVNKDTFQVSLVKLTGLLLFSLFVLYANGQTNTTKSKHKVIYIEEAGSIKTDPDIIANAQRVLDSVKIRHKNTIIFCDSAWNYSDKRMVDAFGNVHIINNDTVHLYANFINYNGDTQLAKAKGDVTLQDPTMTLVTDKLDFDMANDIGYYNTGGTIVDSLNTLTSIIGRYYTQLNELIFQKDVELINDDYTLTSDTLRYNTQTETAFILGPTHIYGDSTYIYSEEGWFDTNSNKTKLSKNALIKRENTQLQGDTVYYDDTDASGYAKGNVVIEDFSNQTIISGHRAWYNDFTENAIVTDSAFYILYDEHDSLFLHADTLLTIPDTSAVDEKLIINYYGVRFYRTDLQGKCDSLIYHTKDSTIQLFIKPVLWSNENQMTSNYIEIQNHSDKPDEVHMKDNSFIVQQVSGNKFNQIKGKNMIGFISNNQLYRVDVNGNGQSVYYPADEDGIIGLNKAESSNIRLHLRDNQIKRISFLKSPKGVMTPLQQVDTKTSLDGFNWLDDIRPKSKYDLYIAPIDTLNKETIIDVFENKLENVDQQKLKNKVNKVLDIKNIRGKGDK